MEDFPAPANSQWPAPAPAILGLRGPGQNPAPGRPLVKIEGGLGWSEGEVVDVWCEGVWLLK